MNNDLLEVDEILEVNEEYEVYSSTLENDFLEIYKENYETTLDFYNFIYMSIGLIAALLVYNIFAIGWGSK